MSNGWRGLDGRPVEPTLPATASAFAKLSIDRAHLEVIDQLLSSAAATRLEPDVWAGAEATLAQWATSLGPKDLQVEGRRLIDTLDQDGPEPRDDADNQVNELHLGASRDGNGGRITGRLESTPFDALHRAIHVLLKPEDDERKSLAQRQADALGGLCEHALDSATLPEQGGENRTCHWSWTTPTSLAVSKVSPSPGRGSGHRKSGVSPATRRYCRLSWAVAASRLMWAASNASPPNTSAAHSPPETAGARTPDVSDHPTGAPHITSATGRTAVPPKSAIW